MVTERLNVSLAAPSSEKEGCKAERTTALDQHRLAITAVISRRFSAKVRKSRMNHNFSGLQYLYVKILWHLELEESG